MKDILQALSLSDRYERKARLLPGLIVASPAALTVAALSASSVSWYEVFGIGIGAETILAFVMGYLARARGKATEVALWAKWGGPPTTRWLRPADESRSEHQKSKWRGAIKRLTGLVIPVRISAKCPEGDIDEDYGQARNLHGLRWHWVVVAALSVAVCGVLLILGQRPWLALGLSAGSLLIALLITRDSEELVRRCADRYGESFFAALLMYDEAKTNTDEKAKAAEAGH